MRVSVTEAKGQLTELVRRAEGGDDIVLTRHGREAVRLVPVARTIGAAERLALMRRLQAVASAKATPGADAAHSQDELYDEDGLPR